MAEREPRPIPEPTQTIPAPRAPVVDHALFDGLMQEAERLSPDELAQINQAADALQLSLELDGIRPPAKAAPVQPEADQGIPTAAPAHVPQPNDKP